MVDMPTSDGTDMNGPGTDGTSEDGAQGGGRGRPSEQNTGASAGRDDLSRRLTALARDLQQQDRPQDVLERVVHAAVAMVPGAEHASISLATRRRDVRSAAATDDVGRGLDDAQNDLGQGPCVDSAYDHLTVRVDDLAAETRWPELAQRAEHLRIGSLLCLQLYVEGDDLGALNLVSSRKGAFSDDSEHVGLFVAAHAAVAFAGARKLTGMAAALANRDLIGQAKGILMARYAVDADGAFSMLSQLSQDTNHKLVEVAEAVVGTGELRASLSESGTRPATARSTPQRGDHGGR